MVLASFEYRSFRDILHSFHDNFQKGTITVKSQNLMISTNICLDTVRTAHGCMVVWCWYFILWIMTVPQWINWSTVHRTFSVQAVKQFTRTRFLHFSKELIVTSVQSCQGSGTEQMTVINHNKSDLYHLEIEARLLDL